MTRNPLGALSKKKQVARQLALIDRAQTPRDSSVMVAGTAIIDRLKSAITVGLGFGPFRTSNVSNLLG